MSFEVQNWSEYEAGLRRRGSLTLWIEDGALALQLHFTARFPSE